jgi:hypothetical protein
MTDAQEVLDALEEIHRDEQVPVASAPDVAKRLDVDRRQVLDLLDALEAVDAVGSVSIGRGRGFWSRSSVTISSGGMEIPPAEPLGGSQGSDRHDSSPPLTPTPDPDGDSTLTDVVRDLDAIPGSGDKFEERVDALLAVLEELDGEELRAGEIRSRVFERYDGQYGSERSWWKNFVSPALSELRERDVVVLVDRHDGIWTLA